MSSRKRKRNCKDVKCVFFPDDVDNGLQKLGREPSSLSSVSTAKSWERCGDSFLGTPVMKNLKSSGRKLSDIRKLAQSPASVQTSAAHCDEDPVHIAWSSSDSEQSDNETQEKHLSRVVAQQRQRPQRPGRPSAPIQSYIGTLRMLRTDKDDPPVIDTDSDLDESEEDVEKDSGQQISECESEPSDEKLEDFPLEAANMPELEISGYVSDGESIEGTVTSSRLDTESQTGEGSKRSVSDWVRSAQAMLQTPEKPQSKRESKTPEDSAKKKRKFQSGGLAERLNRLQCRQRSAVSFWRHQSVSDTSATTADRPGVLVLEVLEVQEECSMQLAHCEHHRPLGEGHQHSHPLCEERARVLVLFNRETAAQLIPAPRDIVHIYPPWQSLSIQGFSCDIILNTHFSQKVYSANTPASSAVPRGLLSAKRCSPYDLCKIFGLLEECKTAEEISAKQVAASDALCSFGGLGVLSRHCLSLLEAIEGLGQAGSVGQDVEVVVQRVYSIPVPDCSPVSILKPRLPSAPPPAEKGKTRLCVLVQDSYGMFSVVQLHLLSSMNDLHQYCHMWQGRTCVLKGIKVMQRVTRERRTRLFNLIDSLWPPVMPLKDHGNTLGLSSEGRPAGPAPSFCYLLSGQESSVEPSEEQTVSLLYHPPTKQTLRDVLQSDLKTRRCSFVATVLHKKIMQSTDVGQGEVWLVLTDPSLQEEQPERPCRRTVALCVSTSCVLTSSVLEALNSPAACHMSFRDAIREHGVLLCAEQSVVELCSVDPDGRLESSATPELLSQSLSTPQAKTLPQPVRLDPLSPEITPNSLCSLSGVIVGVDESTAYSWPACNHCGSDNMEVLAERTQILHCVSCQSVVDKPDMRIQMEVFLSSSLNNCTLKVKLQKKTIMSLLNTAALEGHEFPGYDVENVLGKEVGPLAVYVRVVTRKPALWIGVEEICL
ncbi:DNA repair-scaffolding protein isoform X1 [Epinephelus fuscoguttatus]|uniref:DNA repair-scaffolding protein isoform X1 n=2 Tax=Epinephelus fuscoguttatus TaxID=293821 RepID=UPI0020D1EA24|nr:DNA repair-scaffolding protein isoform X1 [Epinephelus fuscoguttatus]